MLRRISNTVLFVCLLITFFPLRATSNKLTSYVSEVMGIIQTVCKDGKYFNPPKRIIKFNKLPDNVIGQCSIFYPIGYVIEIDPVYWNKASKDDRFQLVAHEFAHCLLFAKHVDDIHNFMYPELTTLDKEIVIQQLITLAEEKCHAR